ncbi:hypothetical protein BDQ12DRAFT_669456 [Crucibulum laeve]|uniref:GTP cyclohydrolase N-terminal domain-containing protein n=1 Tax=Crucibulum laeve TaxID=68775 RepID=A0A5C3LP56_9AGAR|nr:hypothetical protein BDQ12DRAFT_669456 [Crucibulum laeve]
MVRHGPLVPSVFNSLTCPSTTYLASLDIRPTSAITKTHLQMGELDDAARKGDLKTSASLGNIPHMIYEKKVPTLHAHDDCNGSYVFGSDICASPTSPTPSKNASALHRIGTLMWLYTSARRRTRVRMLQSAFLILPASRVQPLSMLILDPLSSTYFVYNLPERRGDPTDKSMLRVSLEREAGLAGGVGQDCWTDLGADGALSFVRGPVPQAYVVRTFTATSSNCSVPIYCPCTSGIYSASSLHHHSHSCCLHAKTPTPRMAPPSVGGLMDTPPTSVSDNEREEGRTLFEAKIPSILLPRRLYLRGDAGLIRSPFCYLRVAHHAHWSPYPDQHGVKAILPPSVVQSSAPTSLPSTPATPSSPTPASYSIYRGLSIAMGALDPTHKPDYSNTEPPIDIPPTLHGSTRPGHLVPSAWTSTPSITVSKAYLKMSELDDTARKREPKVDGSIMLQSRLIKREDPSVDEEGFAGLQQFGIFLMWRRGLGYPNPSCTTCPSKTQEECTPNSLPTQT